jgi:signal transduction histidine kinase
MLQGAFQHRSGRVIALGRLVLASVFLIAIWLDPSQPNQFPGTAYALLTAYVAWSAVLLVLTWSSWWFQYRLAAIAHQIDVASFAVLVFFTEGYTSPFYTFFVFLILSAAIRWGWRETALTSVAILILFLAAGAAALAIGGAEFDLQRLLIRFSHLVVLSLLLIWFGVYEQAGSQFAPHSAWIPPNETDLPPIQPAMRRVAERMKAGRIVFAWWQREEPWINISELEGEDFTSERVGPEHYAAIFSDSAHGLPFLFDARRDRGLRTTPDDRNQLIGFRQSFQADFARRFRLRQGLAVRVRARDYEGEMLALEVGGLCTDDLRTGYTLGLEIAALFDQASMLAVSEEAAVARAKMSLARDLHDSVVQVLAGTSFRLEALKSWIKAGNDADADIEAMKAELATEQRNVRTFIAGLRSGRSSTRLTDLASGLHLLVEQVRRRWDLDFDLSGASAPIKGPLWFEHELHQIIREAATNAARHGKATAMTIEMVDNGGMLELNIADNGIGFHTTAAPVNEEQQAQLSPWSVHERVKGLGGTLSLSSGSRGSQLRIRVPLENDA